MRRPRPWRPHRSSARSPSPRRYHRSVALFVLPGGRQAKSPSRPLHRAAPRRPGRSCCWAVRRRHERLVPAELLDPTAMASKAPNPTALGRAGGSAVGNVRHRARCSPSQMKSAPPSTPVSHIEAFPEGSVGSGDIPAASALATVPGAWAASAVAVGRPPQATDPAPKASAWPPPPLPAHAVGRARR